MKTLPTFLAALSVVASLVLSIGCEDDSGSDGGSSSAAGTQNVTSSAANADGTAKANDVTGSDSVAEGNDRNLVVCIGDSITQGYASDGAPFPSILAGMTGKTVVNSGVGGATASAAPGAAQSAVARKPGYVCILYGSNDAIHGRDPGSTKESLRAAIGVCKAAGAKVVIGTPPPMRDSHAIYNGRAKSIAEAIRALASEEGVSCVDLYGAFGNGSGLLVSDGLHPNAAGAKLIASKFKSKL